MKLLNKAIAKKIYVIVFIVTALLLNILSCHPKREDLSNITPIEISDESEETSAGSETSISDFDKDSEDEDTELQNSSDKYSIQKIYVDFKAPYATYSIINDGYAVLYKLDKNKVSNYKNKVVAVNAGHGTKGGATVKTFSHPDFSPKVTGGANAAGSILSAAVSAGATFENGMTEANANLVVAYALKDKLLNAGYSVLMIIEN